MPVPSLRPKQAQSNARRQLKVQQLLMPEIERLQQKELQSQVPLTINRKGLSTPKQQAKPQVKSTIKTTQKQPSNRLVPPYKKTKTQPAITTPTRTLTFGDTTIELPRDQHKLEAMKEAALEYWRNLPDIS